jgi:hypothetical protein
MAGSGTIQWATGDTVTAANFQSYVQDQVVAVYADATARDAAYGGTGEPTLAEGMVCYLKDTNKIQTYDGSAWADVSTDPAGSDHQVQWNDNGSFGADSGLTWDASNLKIGTATAYLNVTGGSNEVLKMARDDGSGRPYISFWNRDGSGTLERKAYIGYPHANSDSSALYIHSDHGAIQMSGRTFLTNKTQTGQSSYTVEPWAASTIALGDYGSIGTQGSYRTYMSWNYERGTDSNYHHLDVNSYPQAGHVAIGNSGIIFGFDADFETTHTSNPTTRVYIDDTQMNVQHMLRLGNDSTNGPFLTSADDELRVENNYGYIDLGPKNSTANHIYGSLPNLFIGIEGAAKFGFTGDEFYPYNNNATELGIAGNRWERLHVNEIYGDIGSQTDPSYTFTGDTNTGMYSTSNVLRFTTNGTQKGLFSSSGFYAIKAVSTGTYALWASSGYLVAFSSSERYKENISALPKSEWEKIYQLEAKSFDWKEDGSVEIDPNRGKEDHGFIAEEVVDILPKVVNYDKVDHEDPESEYVVQSVNYGELTPYLVEAVKDLKARIETLEGS